MILSSCLLFVVSCSPSYQQMQSATADVNVLQKFKPAFTVALYNTTVDVMSNHLSGLLLIKKMPDSSTRVVFSNEMGLGFFDFEFAPDGSFKVYSIMKKLNKKSVIKTLQHDFDLLLMNNLDNTKAVVKTNEGLTYFIFPQSKGFNYYITNQSGDELVRMERASNKKIIVEAVMKNYINGIPDTIGISHKTFEFNIGLKRIER
ncbi:MAG: hypothetical protein IPF72_03690 [Chitinophagaceae bacterium]|nr:hypothetical protein [Chitinophagaceae bacterium]